MNYELNVLFEYHNECSLSANGDNNHDVLLLEVY